MEDDGSHDCCPADWAKAGGEGIGYSSRKRGVGALSIMVEYRKSVVVVMVLSVPSSMTLRRLNECCIPPASFSDNNGGDSRGRLP